MGLFSDKPKNSKNKALHYKDENCAVLILFASGNYDEFNREFSTLTSQGYEMKTSYVPPVSFAGFSVTLGSFFYFQKIKNNTITDKNEEQYGSVLDEVERETHTPSNFTVVKKTSNQKEQESSDVNMQKCKNCGNSNHVSAKFCKLCERVF